MKKTIKVKERLEQYLSKHCEALEKKKNYLISVIEEALQTDKAIEYIIDNQNDYLKLKYYLRTQIYNEWKSDLDEIFVISFKIYLDNNLIIEVISKNSFATDIKISQDLFIESNSTGTQQAVSPNVLRSPNRPVSYKPPQDQSEREAQVNTRIMSAHNAAKEAALKLMS